MLVEIDPGTDRAAVRSFAINRGGYVRYEYEHVLPRVMNLRNIPHSAIEELKGLPGVVAVHPDQFHENVLKLDESTPLIRGLQSQLGGAGLAADGTGVRVCVVDTGIDSDHLMYADRIDAAAGYDFENNDGNPEDDNGHGSHVAGIAVGGTGLSVNLGCEGDEPFQGVAPAATLIGVKVLNSGGGGSDSNIIAGIDHCADPSLPGGPADVMNLSIGTGQYSGACDTHLWAQAANNAVAAGVVVVAAAGNEGYSNALASPACGSEVISVGATYKDDYPNCEDSQSSFTWCLDWLCLNTCTDNMPRVDDLVCFSNNSSMLDVAAPGSVILSVSTAAGGSSITGNSGTSQASPHVAGLAALVLDLDPTLTPSQVRQIIRDGAVDMGPAGFDTGYGYGRVDVIDTLSLVEPEVCGNATCGAGEDACSCAQDCGDPPAAETGLCTDGTDNDCDGSLDCADLDCSAHPACQCDNDGVCELGEDCNNCSGDCFSGSGASCGNGLCEAGDGEDCVSCPADCNSRQGGKPSGRFCCGDGDATNPVSCADARCSTGGFTCTDVPTAASCCGDLACQGSEDSFKCEVDCGPAPFCGDGSCDASESPCDCPQDCGSPPSSEAGSCSDGADNDCDTFIDCD
ncbi:MAG: S8 family serine peptidase, partial [Acidobacteriota bacterium]